MDVHDTLLLASGSADCRSSLCSIFEDSFNLLEADNNYQAIMFLEQNHDFIAAVILDLSIPEKVDLSVLEKLSSMKLQNKIPVIVISSDKSPETVALAFDLGAVDIFFSGYDSYILQRRVQNTIELYRHKWQLEEMVEAQSAILRHSNNVIVDTLSSIIEYRSVESGQHILRIRHFVKVLLKEVAHSCPEYKLTEHAINIISSAAALHDIGKIAIPDAVLTKPGKLNAKEWEIMKNHTVSGSHILESLHDVTNEEYLQYAYKICYYHHERWDGSGYPEGLSGDDIPICAQVVGLADAYDALTTQRVYKDAVPYKQAANMIVNGECGLFSPKLLECFKSVADKFESLAREFSDGLSPDTETFDVPLPTLAPQKDIDTLQSVQAKFLTLLHYLNGTAAEIDLNTELFHVLYNPHLKLASLNSTSSFDELLNILFQIVIPEEHPKLLKLLKEDLHNFFESGVRKMVYYFHVYDGFFSKPDLYQVTLLRLDFSEGTRKLIVILKKDTIPDTLAEMPSMKEYNSEEYLRKFIPDLFCCRNDRWLSFEQPGSFLISLLGYTAEEFKDLFDNRLTNLMFLDDIPVVRRQILDRLTTDAAAEITYRLLDKSGNIVWVLHKIRLVDSIEGIEYLYGSLSDITLSRDIQNEQLLRLKQYQTIFAHTKSILFEWDTIKHKIAFSNQWKEVFGYDPIMQNLLYNLSSSHLHPEDIPPLFEHIHALQNGSPFEAMEGRIAKSNGHYLWCRFQATAIRDDDGKIKKILGIITNIDVEKQIVKALKDQAEQDVLTKLLNKHAARRQIEEYLNAFPQETRCALMIIDLDNFKQINDQFGHMFGDAVLTQTAWKIKSLVRTQDIVARIGGDEFMVFMRGVSNRKLIQHRCTKLIFLLQNILQEQLFSCPISCSIGIALGPEHGTSYYELFQHADLALYQVKKQGKNNFMFYNNKISSFPSRRQTLTAINERIDSDEKLILVNNSIVQYAFHRLYSSNDLNTGIRDILELIGQQLNVSRVYIFENSSDDQTCSNTFEWCNTGVKSQAASFQNISYEMAFQGFENNFNEQGIFYCTDITTLPKPLYEIVSSSGIQSSLQYAIRDNGVFKGFVGFDECSSHRLWTKEQIDMLTYIAEILSVFLLKKRAEDKLDLLSKTLE